MLLRAKRENKIAVFSIHFRCPAGKFVHGGGSCEQAECEGHDVRVLDARLVGEPGQWQQLASLPAGIAPLLSLLTQCSCGRMAHTSASELCSPVLSRLVATEIKASIL